MAKTIFQGRNGLSSSIKNENDKYSVGAGIDPFREWGFLKPAVSGTTITPTGGWDAYAIHGIVDITKTYNGIFAISEKKIWSIDTSTNVATSVHDVSGATVFSRIIAYPAKIGGTLDIDATFFFYGTSGGRYDGSTWSDGVLSTGAVDEVYIWQNYLMLAAGQYIHRFDGGTGDNGTLTSNWFNVGTNWEIKSFFSYYNYLGVVTYNVFSLEYQILLLDGSSTTLPVKRIATSDIIYGSHNINNDIIFDTSTGMKTLGDNGLENINNLISENPTSIGTLTSYRNPTSVIVSGKHNNIIHTSFTNKTMGFGRKDNNNPYIISDLYTPTGDNITMIKSCGGLLFVGSFTAAGGAQHLQYFSTGNSTATFKYPFKDFGQKVRINSVEYFFKPLASGNTATAGLDIDYNTAITLKDNSNASTIAYATDGAITHKKFNVGRDCYSCRPTLSSWTGMSLAYAVVDYTPLPETK